MIRHSSNIASLDDKENEIINRLLREAYAVEDEPGYRLYEGEVIGDEDNEIVVEEEEEEFEWNAADYISEAKDRHRRSLKLGEIPYNVAWMDGFTHIFKTPIPYKVGSRLRKAFEAGKRARNEK